MAVFPRRSTPVDDHGQPLNRDYRKNQVADRQIDEVIGLCKGILADGMVNQGEAETLLKWLENNRESANKWPNCVLYPRIEAMLQDGILDDEEESELLALLTGVTGSPEHTAEGTSASTALPLDDPAPRVSFNNEVFCLTGRFASGPRREVEAAVEKRGGHLKDSPTKKTSFLVIGELGSRDWQHSPFGRKIEKAIEYREKGAPIALISEERFFEYLHG